MGRNSISAVGSSKMYSEDGHTMIPKDVREEIGLEEDDKLDFIVEDGEIRVIPQ